MKNLFTKLLLIAALLLPTTANAYDFMVDGLCYNIINNNSVEVTYQKSSSPSYTSLSGTLIIPENVTYRGNTYTVIGIKPYAFRNCDELTSVTIPYTISPYRLDIDTFVSCDRLEEVTINNHDIVSLGFSTQGSFCLIFGSQVKKYILGNEVRAIGDNSFQFCSKLTSIVIPNSVVSIGKFAFSGCSGLKDFYSHIEHPENVELGKNVFSNVPKDACTLHVPRGTEATYRECYWWKDFVNIIDDINDEITGDVDGNGIIDVEDVNAAINIILKLKSISDYPGNGDMEGNGIIDVEDINAMINIILKLV